MSSERTQAAPSLNPSSNGHAAEPNTLGPDDWDGGVRGHRAGGLTWQPVFAPASGDVYETVEWNYRDVMIRATDGSVVFEQARVHAPASWSDQAVQVVASKYFHGDRDKGNDPRTGGRESSVKQLIERVCSTVAKWGLIDGYFASQLDAEAFWRDLTWLCLHQHASFNSPVWFNLGLGQVYGLKGDADNFVWSEESGCVLQCGDTYIHPQASACFIQPVEDSIEGIMALAASEARLFKGGSGTGTDLSTLRSSREHVKGGGHASGPVSFMRIWDSVAGTIKSGGRSRRAAKIQTLRCDHPDIREFVVCKRDEDRKAKALIASGGAKPGMTGAYDEAYSSVMYQNSNISVRLLDSFMQAVETPGAVWKTRPVLQSTTDPMPEYDASKLLDLMAECTWECGDTGYQFHDTINRWNTTPNSGEIRSSNPCAEYNHIDNSACNLASINLMQFLRTDGSFDANRFRAACRTMTVAQDILIDRASYPTAPIAETAHRFRQLGLGYANLGGLLMAMGLPYDSDEGRVIAGAVTAVMHGAALEASSELAAALGPFDAYEENREAMRRVVKMHRDASYDLLRSAKDMGGPFDMLSYLATRAMDAAWTDGLAYGYRNSQSTLLAPTGTIGFMMDCATFSLEPELGLVKYKNLAGGGVMKIVNPLVGQALKKLGYSGPGVIGGDEHVAAILAYIKSHDMIQGCPLLDACDMPVFDCSFEPPGGGRSISPSGHVKMLAAVQPFLSGAASKTINLPNSATPADVRQVVLDAWRLGVKALAIYRDGSKGAQPLSTSPCVPDGKSTKASPDDAATAVMGPATAIADPSPKRRRLPDTRASLTHKFCVAGHEGYITVGLYPDGSPGELFITMAKEGSTVGGLMDAVATSVSLGLQYGVPLSVYVHKFSHGRYEPSGPTPNPAIRFASSLTDYVFRWLGARFPEGAPPVMGGVDLAVPGADRTAVVVLTVNQSPAIHSDAPPCPDCGTLTVRRGTCHHCPNCSWTGGCG